MSMAGRCRNCSLPMSTTLPTWTFAPAAERQFRIARRADIGSAVATSG